MIKGIQFLILFFVLTLLSVNADPPEPGVGERWVRNDQYSDEFNGDTLNSSKWRPTFNGWKGRQPAYFDPASVSVSGGYLVIRNHPGVPNDAPNGYNFSGGAVQSKGETSHFGYYECSFKASRINMSTTFWLSSSKKSETRTSDPNDEYSQELDICESIGGSGNFSSDFRTKMKFNTHYRLRKDPWPTPETFYSRGNNQVEIRDGDLQGGDASLKTSESWEDFHTYACNWRSAQDAQFFVNDRFIGVVKFRTDIVPDPFKDPMRINMVTETYDWARPLPTTAQLNNNNINASYYDWVRTYVKLPVDQPTSMDNEGESIFVEMVAFRDFELVVPSSNRLTFTGLYKANRDREIVITIKDAAGAVVGTEKYSALAGYGKALYSVNLINALAKGQYTATIELRSTNGNLISTETKSFAVGEGTILPLVDFVSTPEIYFTSSAISFDINYTTDISRDLVLVLTSPSGQWLGSKTITVPSGSSTENLVINLAEAPDPAADYKVSAILRAVGGDWQTNVAVKDIFVDFVDQGTCPENGVFNECFEGDGLSSWGGWGSAVREITDTQENVFAGNYALKIKGLGAGEYLVEGLEPNQNYEVNGFMKVVSSSRVTLGVKAYNDSGVETFEFRTNTDYENITLSFTTGQNSTSALIYFYSPQETGEGYLDNLSLRKAVITAVDQSEIRGLSLYPNPTNDMVTLGSEERDLNWEVYSALGRQLLKGEGATIDLANLDQGMYIIRVNGVPFKVYKR